MTGLPRLVTFADTGNEPAWTGQVNVNARHELELADGRRVLLLNDRGYGSTSAWDRTSLAEVEFRLRTAVGPDEPFDDLTASRWRPRTGSRLRAWRSSRVCLSRLVDSLK